MSSRTEDNVTSAAIRTRVEEDIGWLILDNRRAGKPGRPGLRDGGVCADAYGHDRCQRSP